MKNNLTQGSVLKNVLYFSLPFLLSYFLQTLYGMADLFIIGQYGSVADITAVSIGSQVMHMLTVMIVGLAMGTTVTISRSVGAEKHDDAAMSIGNTAVLFMCISAAVTVLLLALAKPIAAVMSTPSEAVGGTVSYLTVCFMGIPFITAYNIISSVFRGMGDSKSPMYFIAVACAANIGLDYLFMGVFKLGPAGAALGTVLSQTISVIISLIVILKKDTGIRLTKSNFKPHRRTIGDILKIGVPIALQDGFIQISFIVITIIANRRGLTDAAAVGIVEKVIGIFFLVPSSMLSSVSALAAQNIGANKLWRARLTLRYAICFAMLFGIAVSVITQFCSERILGFFGKDKDVIISGSRYLKSYVWDCVFAGATFCFSGYFCALGKSVISFIHNVCSIVLVRIPAAYVLSAMFSDTLYPMGLASPLGSLFSMIICIGVYIYLIKRKQPV